MKIVQVGGGTAGWMTAFALSKCLPNVELTVIHNDKPIGVGEATFENIRHYHSFLGIDEKEFMKACDATFKFGIWFDNFINIDKSYCHLFQYGTTRFPYKDIEQWRWQFGNEPLVGIEWSKFMNPYTNFLLENKIPLDTQTLQAKRFPLAPEEDKVFLGGYGYHMDAVKYQEFLKSQFIPQFKIIESTVDEIHIDENGIDYITIKDNEDKIRADLFIDCTGFNQVLIKNFGDSWEDFGDYLPNNRAVVCRVPYKNHQKEMCPFTRCTGMNAGWKWTIPLYSRLSHGYVYSDGYITSEQAEAELRTYLGWEGDVNHIKFRSGYQARSWIGNCVALGLSSFFVEPIESTGIAVFIRQIIDILRVLEKGHVKELDRDWWDATNIEDAQHIKNFIVHHFIHTSREDTAYWKDWKYNRTLDKMGINQYKWLRAGHSGQMESSASNFYAPNAFDHILSAHGATVQQSKFMLQYHAQKDFPDQMTHHPRQSEGENIEKDYQDFLEWKTNDDKEYVRKVKNAPIHYDYVKYKIHD